MKKIFLMMFLLLVSVRVFSADFSFVMNLGAYFDFGMADRSMTTSYKNGSDHVKLLRAVAFGLMTQLGLGVQFDNEIASGFTLLGEGGVGVGSIKSTYYDGDTASTPFSFYGGFVTELLLLNGMVNLGFGVSWYPLGFSIKPSISTIQISDAMKIGLGVPIYITEGSCTGAGVSIFVAYNIGNVIIGK